MQFVGDSVTKIEATRSEKLPVPIKIEANVKLTDVEHKEIFAAGEKKDSVIVKYEFGVNYSDKAKITIGGAIFVFGEKKELTSLAKAWKKKDKKLDSDLNVALMNRAMELAYLTAIPVAKELKLPTPLRIPRFVKEKKTEKKDYVG